ncbi:PE-PPE domain-containing protein [Mycobacterium dioxanotrophicus]|uniref:PE-PPE domain-containing protein n=1 Tax=Mycobacterium dioxanotrophicus TaxID=482462 RepID=A0A1Y0C9T2_9MYCO|nr:PE-PPE domain-containing protein [Mycobacterium dioxanotrophicus]ART72003.1 PE-PPE domain-containing protein [Mycobacterium dioxanotrophicus]
MSHPTPARLQKTKAAAVATAVVATTAALTAGVASSAPEVLLAEKRTVTAEVSLTAAPQLPSMPKIVGIYGVGPVFWAAELLGITPQNVIEAAAGVVGGSELATAVNQLLDVLDKISPIEAGVKGPLPSDVYDAVNGLQYTTTGVADALTAPIKGIPVIGPALAKAFANAVAALVETAPILNQRRAIIFSESLGGLTTSLAYRDMIKAVQSDDPDWGAGVTGQWLVFFNNPSRPGGGLFALATPVTNLLGVNLSTPPAGSYTNEDANNGNMTKVLNTSILDITWAYNPLSDAPTTLNPLAWANAAAGGVFLTYLIPSDGNNIDSLIVPLGLGIADGLKVMLDPTGGQGVEMVPGWADIVRTAKDIDWLHLGLGEALDKVADATKFPGTATYLTYDSGNLPLLEPFDMAPRLLNLVPGVHVPTPVTDSVEDALRMLVNMGYQDVDPVTLQRNYTMGGQQAYLWHSPLTPTQQLAATQTVFNALVDGIEANALTPSKWTPKLPGVDLSPVTQNPLSEAGAKALRDAIDQIQKNVTDPMFNAVETGLAPVTGALDGVNAQVTDAIDTALKVKEPGKTAARSTTSVSALAAPAPVTSLPSSDTELRTLDVPSSSTRLDKTAQKITESLKAAPGKHAADPSDPLKKSVKDTVAKVRTGVNDTAGKVEQAGKDIAKKVEKVTKPAKEQSKDSAPKGKSAKASGKAAA